MINYIHIATFTYPSDLTMVKSTLENNDIDCYVRDEMTVQVHSFLSNAIGGIKLEVSQIQYDKALKILKESGFENYIASYEKSEPEKRKEEKTRKFLKIVIKIIVAICLIWILAAISFQL